MNWRKGLGIGLLFVGLFLVVTGRVITGAVVGASPTNYLGMLGLLVFVIGVVLIITTKFSSELGDLEIKAIENVEVGNEAHNISNYQKMLERLGFAEAHGVTPEVIESPKAWVTMYHAYPRGKKLDFSKGLDKKKSSSGFFFAPTKFEAAEALEIKGHTLSDIDILKIKISRNVYDPDSNKSIVRHAPSTDGDFYFIPAKKYKKANKLIDKGLIKFE